MSRIRRKRSSFGEGFAVAKPRVSTPIISKRIPIAPIAPEPVVQPKAVIQMVPSIAPRIAPRPEPVIVPKTELPKIPVVAQPAKPAFPTAPWNEPSVTQKPIAPAVTAPAAPLPPIMARFVSSQPSESGEPQFAPAQPPAQPQPDFEDTGPTVFTDQYETAEAEEREEAGDMDDDSGFGADVPIVASHVQNGVFRTVAIVHTPMGCFPITAALPAKGAANGFVRNGGNVFKRAINGAKRVINSKKSSVGKELAAENLVNRSRQGDQNAMAIIVSVRENAKTGDLNARHSFRILKNYIATHPASSDMGAEQKNRNHVMGTAMMLANGPPITNERIEKFVKSFGPEARAAHAGIVNSAKRPKKVNDTIRQSALDMGRAIGIAQRIQSVRMPGSTISKFDPRIGWELGE